MLLYVTWFCFLVFFFPNMTTIFFFSSALCVNKFPEYGGVRSGEQRQKKEQMLNYISFALFPLGDNHVIRVQLPSCPCAAIRKKTCADMHWKEAQTNNQKKSQHQTCRFASLVCNKYWQS